MFSLSFDTDNAAFGLNDDNEPTAACAREIARILAAVAKRIAHGDTEGRIMDVNGNTIGSFRLEDR
jgi:hypothetical protein